MGAPQTLPANFSGWDQAPATLPSDFSKWDAPKTAAAQPSALARFKDSFLSGLGIGTDEDAKKFFKHPIDTALNSLNAQGELAQKAKDAYDRGDYKSAVIHGLNYLIPFIGQQTDKAGEQLSQGDIAGGIGRTLGAAAPIVAGSPEVQATASDVAGAAAAKTAQAAKVVSGVIKDAATPENIATAVGGAAGGKLGSLLGEPLGGAAAGAAAGRALGKSIAKRLVPKEAPAVYPGAPLPEHPGVFPGAPEPTATLEQLNPSLSSPARSLPGQISPEVIRPKVTPAAPIPPRTGLALTGEVAAPPRTLSDLSGETPAGAGVPRTLSGESALRQILTGQDNANLLKIARSRGINVSQEAQLKPSAADSRLVNKIIEDHSADELDTIRDQYLENTRMGKHNFGDIGPEAWKTMSLQTYFPDVKIPASQLIRTRTAITNAPLKNALPETGTVGDVPAAIKAAQPKTLKDLSGSATAPPTAASSDLTSLLQQSVDQAHTQGVQTTASPTKLMKRWGVDEESLTSGREQTRGMSPKETEADLDQLTERYKKGEAVEPIVEMRDADNNVISVDGRARAIAAKRAGVKRIPIIVRRAEAAAQ